MNNSVDFLMERYNSNDIHPVSGRGTNELYRVTHSGRTVLVKIAGI